MRHWFYLMLAVCQLHFDSKVDMRHAVDQALDYAESYHLVYWSIVQDDDTKDLHSVWLCWKI